MPDISMCLHKSCPARDTCYRFRAIPSPRGQSYMGRTVPEGADRCSSFVAVAPGDYLKPVQRATVDEVGMGKVAFDLGLSFDENPHDDCVSPDEHSEWSIGWLTAHHEKEDI